MKKLFIVLAFAGLSTVALAQETKTTEVPQMKYSVATNSFWSNWFIQANATYNAFYSNEEQGLGFSKSPFKDFRRTIGASVAIGKWFTPGLGLRTKISGIWGRQVATTDKSKNDIKMWNAQEQALFNLSNLICGYNETRVWNFIPYAGAGVARDCSDNCYAMGLSAGILNTFRISKHVAINLDLGYNMLEPDFDKVTYATNGTKVTKDARGFKNHDNYFSGEIGLTFNLGKATWNKVPDVDALQALNQSQIDALNAQLADQQAENAKLKDMLKNQKPANNEVQTVKEVVSTPSSVFFNINKAKVASRKDLQNVKEIADYAKANNAKVVVTGYADSKTGSSEYNQNLSKKRADAVADELVKMGVSRDNIETVAAGGVKDLSPISYNRRATVELQ